MLILIFFYLVNRKSVVYEHYEDMTSGKRFESKFDEDVYDAFYSKYYDTIYGNKERDVELLKIKPSESECLTGDLVEKALTEFHKDKTKRVFVIVATAGTTNLGIIDDLLSIGKVAKNFIESSERT